MSCRACAKIRRLLPMQVQRLLAQRAARRNKPTTHGDEPPFPNRSPRGKQ